MSRGKRRQAFSISFREAADKTTKRGDAAKWHYTEIFQDFLRDTDPRPVPADGGRVVHQGL